MRTGNPTDNLAYRPDIDGLRAIAVLGVIFFHAGWQWISGGYVGVDVFFVISGYLITRNILARQQSSSFSIIDFFKRRILRLFPALFITVLVTLLVSYFVLTPQQLTETAYSASAAIMAFANMFFWTQTGYWDSEILSKPLVHTWTLSVEEQFYFIWPFLLAFLYRFRSGMMFGILAGLGVASLVASIWLTPKYPQAAFYLMPFRVFEFVIGALCVGIDRKYVSKTSSEVFRSVLFVLGLGAIAYAYLRFDDTTLIPGVAVLIPTLGAAAVILAQNPRGLGLILSNKILVYIGLLSYSLYLVHWPVLSFIDQIWGKISFPQMVSALAVIFVLSAALYHGIEKPIRFAKKMKTASWAKVFLGAVTAMLAISLTTQVVGVNKGFPGRYHQDFENIAALTIEDVNAERLAFHDELCREKTGLLCGQIAAGQSNILIIGDSHGPDGLNIMQAALPESNYLIYATPACPPLTNLDNVFFLNNRETCTDSVKAFYREIPDYFPDIDLIVMSVRHERSRLKRIAGTVRWFEGRGIDVIVIGPGPAYSKKLQNVILQYPDVESITIASHAATDIRVMGLEDELNQAVIKAKGNYLSRAKYFCPNGNCNPFINNSLAPVTIDAHHLTRDAAKDFGRKNSDAIHLIVSDILDMGE